MTDNDSNEKITRWLGLHWHTFESRNVWNRCTDGDCGKYESDRDTKPNPDYTTAADCLGLIEAVREKGPTVSMDALGHGDVKYQVLIWPGNGNEHCGRGDR